jgi:hypothetical protein
VKSQIEIFKGKNDDQAWRLGMDILSLLQGQTTNLFIDSVNLAPVYSESEQ